MLYLLDFRIPKSLLPLSNDLYDLYIKECEVKLTKIKEEKIRNAMQCLCYNITYHVKYDKSVVPVTLDHQVYAQGLIYNGVKINRKVSYTYTRSILDWLHSSGRVELTKGGVESWELSEEGFKPTSFSQSYITLSPDFKELFYKTTTSRKELVLHSVLEIKDKDKNVITKRLGDYEREVICTLNDYNLLVRGVQIMVEGQELNIQLKKVYNNSSFSQGGRNFVVGDTSILKRDDRPKIKIDGVSTIELDFSALHPRIAAVAEGVELDPSFDPYAIELYNYDPVAARWFGKMAGMILLNCGLVDKEGNLCPRRAKMALNKVIVDNKETVEEFIQKGLCPKYIDKDAIIDAFVMRNDYIRMWFLEPRGLLLQNTDSKIMDLIIGHFNRIEEIIIPVHDSIVIKESLRDIGLETMRGCYAQVMGSEINCLIKEKNI